MDAREGRAMMTHRFREFVTLGTTVEGETIIDAHTHTGNLRLYIPESGVEGLIRSMERLGIAVSLVSTMLAVTADAGAGNAETLTQQQAFPRRVRGYAVINPRHDEKQNRSELERRLLHEGFAGIKLHPDQHGYPLTGSGYLPAFDFAREHQVVILAHSWAGSAYCDPSVFLTMARQHPEVTLLIGHSGGTLDGQERSIECARQADNLYLDLTCSIRGFGMLERMVDRIGAERLIFGTDSTLIDPAGTLSSVLSARISDDEKRLILGINALRLFGSRLGLALGGRSD